MIPPAAPVQHRGAKEPSRVVGACSPFLSLTNKQHLADPLGSEHPSGCLHRAADFL